MFKVNYPTTINGCNNLYKTTTSSIQDILYAKDPTKTYTIPNIYFTTDNSIIAYILEIKGGNDFSIYITKFLPNNSIDTEFDGTLDPQPTNISTISKPSFFEYKSNLYFIVYNSNVLFYSIDKTTGKTIYYRTNKTIENMTSSFLFNDTLYVFSSDGIVYSIDMNTPLPSVLTYSTFIDINERPNNLSINEGFVNPTGIMFLLVNNTTNTYIAPIKIEDSPSFDINLMKKVGGLDNRFSMFQYYNNLFVYQKKYTGVLPDQPEPPILVSYDLFQYTYIMTSPYLITDKSFGSSGISSLQIPSNIDSLQYGPVFLNDNIYIASVFGQNNIVIYSVSKSGVQNQTISSLVGYGSGISSLSTYNNNLYVSGSLLPLLTLPEGFIKTINLSGSSEKSTLARTSIKFKN